MSFSPFSHFSPFLLVRTSFLFVVSSVSSWDRIPGPQTQDPSHLCPSVAFPSLFLVCCVPVSHQATCCMIYSQLKGPNPHPPHRKVHRQTKMLSVGQILQTQGKEVIIEPILGKKRAPWKCESGQCEEVGLNRQVTKIKIQSVWQSVKRAGRCLLGGGIPM